MPHLGAIGLKTIRQGNSRLCLGVAAAHVVCLAHHAGYQRRSRKRSKLSLVRHTPYITAIFTKFTGLCMSLHQLHHTRTHVQNYCELKSLADLHAFA